ncbi:Hypothetical protein R9X50_00153300 [Acrodontium crateriforme]|uniref:Aldose 1-epimerase n=1 Tax=Acrodontium crateriforme TaxID=150365 RepID=A0AAQ3R8A5_9PEZI|nr:Hypothetical protein R9X50_00153300 [Acrodontium crateriforme]
MLSKTTAILLAASSFASASSPYPPFSGDPFKKYTLKAKGIEASFIPYGARLTNLYVNDKNGKAQDVVLGYDDGNQYLKDTEGPHTYFGPIVGRYANRIKNGTFTIDGVTSHIPTNENKGKDTLHGGFVGYDQQNWTVTAVTSNSITFSFYDEAQSGFPGDVLNVATYTLSDDASWTSRMISIPVTGPTPIMLANHVYWNLGAFVDEEAQLILNDTLYMPLADRIIDIDGIEVPTGAINLTAGGLYDFTAPKTIGQDMFKLQNSCGTGCVGYDNAFINDRPRGVAIDDPTVEVLRMSSPSTGIQMSLETNQQGLQIYTCSGQNGTIPVKKSQQHLQGKTAYVQKYGCIVIETQDWIDGINQQQWGRNEYQVFDTLSQPAINFAKYKFSCV